MSVSKKTAARALVDGRRLDAFWGSSVADTLLTRAQTRASGQTLGDGPRWLRAIRTLEEYGPAGVELAHSAPRLSHSVAQGANAPGAIHADVARGADPQAVEQALLELAPWRKGPFDVFGVELDAEWRCDLKWDRLKLAVDFADRRVLDVGCGNGYYLLRALGAGARAALGVDPTWLYVAQFAALRRAVCPLNDAPDATLPAWVMPLALEDLESTAVGPDIVLSLGVLYHRKSPFEHLERLRSLMIRDSVLVLESLVVPGDARTVLVPEDRYAAMRNVWMIPSVEAVSLWLRRCGFVDVRVVDVSVTTEHEQRVTAFMPSLSLRDFLDPANAQLTREGYPRPRRALLTARAT